MLLTAENIDAAKAEAWGLVEEVVPVAKLDEAVERCVNAIVEAHAASRCGRRSA